MTENIEDYKSRIDSILQEEHPEGGGIVAEDKDVQNIFSYVSARDSELFDAVQKDYDLAMYAIDKYKELNPDAVIPDYSSGGSEQQQESQHSPDDADYGPDYDYSEQRGSSEEPEDVEDLKQKFEQQQQQITQLVQLVQSFVHDPEGTRKAFQQAQSGEGGTSPGGNGSSPQGNQQHTSQDNPQDNSGLGQLANFLNSDSIGKANELMRNLSQFMAIAKSPNQSEQQPQQQSDPTDMLDDQMNMAFGVLEKMTGMFGKWTENLMKINKTLGAATQGIDDESLEPYVEKAFDRVLQKKAQEEKQRSEGQGGEE